MNHDGPYAVHGKSQVIACPRCKRLALHVWPHEHSRFVCGNEPCPTHEAQCHNPACEYPMPAGSAAWCAKHGNTIWDHGHWVDIEIQRIYEAPLEPLPAPFNGVLP
jgi:hypothetical protein